MFSIIYTLNTMINIIVADIYQFIIIFHLTIRMKLPTSDFACSVHIQVAIIFLENLEMIRSHPDSDLDNINFIIFSYYVLYS